MERSPEHMLEDLDLREGFIAQESLDEFLERHQVGHESELGVQPVPLAIGSEWQDTLHPETTINETLYLQGFTSLIARSAVMEQQVAELRQLAIKSGKTQPTEQDRIFDEMFIDWHS